MPLSIIFAIAAFVLVILAIGKLGAGLDDSVSGLFLFPTMPARPRGVQETDLPRFVFQDSKSVDTSAAPAQAA
jgi:hypothetical protein